MIEWMRRFVEPATVAPGTALDKDLMLVMLELRSTLKELQTLDCASSHEGVLMAVQLAELFGFLLIGPRRGIDSCSNAKKSGFRE